MIALKAKLKSSEFWFSLLAIIVGGLMGAGVIGDHTIYSQVGGWTIAALGSSGYTVARMLARAGTDQAGKPGYKTSEFWKAMAVAIITFIETHDLVPKGSELADMLGQLLTFLPVGTYVVARGVAKKGANSDGFTALDAPTNTDLLTATKGGAA